MLVESKYKKKIVYRMYRASQVALVVKSKEPACNAGDTRETGWTSGLGRSPGGGHGNTCMLAWRTPKTEKPSRLL